MDKSDDKMFKVGDWVKTAGDLTGEIIETEAGGMFRVMTYEGNFWHHYSLLSYLKRPKASRDRKVEIFVDGELKAKFVVNPGESITYLVK